jgi:nitrogen fixation protein NifX
VPQPESIAEMLVKLQGVLQGTPPPWLRKALAKDAERSFAFEEDEVTP